MNDAAGKCKLSYAIMTHNEEYDFVCLMEAIRPFLMDNSEVVVVDDFSSSTMVEFIKRDKVKFFQRALNKDFAAQRNFAASQCKGEFIFFLDPDEVPPFALLMNMNNILERMERDRLDACIVPRFNKLVTSNQRFNRRTFEITDADINKDSVEDQLRIYRNTEDLTWKRPLHEKLTGCRRVLRLPSSAEYAILHIKTMQRAEGQIAFYNSLGSSWANLAISIKFALVRMLRRLGLLRFVVRILRGHLVEVVYRG